MGDKFWLQIKCGGCGTDNPSKEDYEADPMENGCYYAPSSGFMDFKCRNCGKINWIQSSHHGKIVTPKELEELYKKEGFENID